jgi:hypothetical protein
MSCASPDERAEGIVLDCLKANNPKAFDLLPAFEKYLITNGHIAEWNNAEVKDLLEALQNGQAVINPADIVPNYGDELEFYSPSKFAALIACFRESTTLPDDTTYSVTRVANEFTKIVMVNNVGPPNDQALVDAISTKDFDKDVYRVPVLLLLWYHMRAAYEMPDPE